MHQAAQPSQGQCGQLVVCQVPRTVHDQGYWQSVGLSRGRGFVEGVARVPGMKQEERSKEQKINTGDSVCSEAQGFPETPLLTQPLIHPANLR